MNVMRTQTHSKSPSGLGTQPHVHTPVLLQEVIDGLDIQGDDVVVDGTLGMGGHSEAMLAELSSEGILIGVDHDPAALHTATKRLASTQSKCIFAENSFEHIGTVLDMHHIGSPDKVLLDLGWGSHTMQSGRGFSFMKDEPLIMTYTDKVSEETLTASDIVNTWSADSLEAILTGWGEEKHARRIVSAIIAERQLHPILTSGALASLIEKVIHRRGKTHPATQTFQALRIAVNDELGVLQRAITDITQRLAKEGRLAIITFHSIEDRLVKRHFKDLSSHAGFELITKKAIQPTRDELKANPRARSAKLRIIKRTT